MIVFEQTESVDELEISKDTQGENSQVNFSIHRSDLLEQKIVYVVILINKRNLVQILITP